MSFAGLLVQQAEIQRREPGEDRLGNPREIYTVIATVPCRVGAAWSGGERNTERMREVIETGNTVYLLPGVDVTERDRIRVLDKNGVEIAPAANITQKQVIVGRDGSAHHIECKIETQREPR